MKPVAPMTYLTTVGGGFHAKVLAARLGAEGIPAVLRGGVDGLYPIFAEVAVFVPAAQLDDAREILLADAVDAVFGAVGSDTPEGGEAAASEPDRRARVRRALAAVAVALVVTLVLVGYLAAARLA